MSEFISATDPNYSERQRGLIRIGQEGIAVENDAALDDYFDRDGYQFHGPTGDLDFEQLKTFFASMRKAFSGFRCERRALIEQGDTIAARTAMFGTFDGVLEASPVGPVQPNGAVMTLELVNFFRYDRESRLVEEWAQCDYLSMLKQLGVDIQPASAS